ncbi:MAG: hypothetical protein Q8936_03290 [Bacillota bacterium]|nr:hypothetical protein [Bacillota bacterium]
MSKSKIKIVVNKPDNINILMEKYTEALAVILTRKISLASISTFSDEINSMLMDTMLNASLSQEEKR